MMPVWHYLSHEYLKPLGQGCMPVSWACSYKLVHIHFEHVDIPKERKFFPFRVDPFSEASQKQLCLSCLSLK